jgi:hypothetical protein
MLRHRRGAVSIEVAEEVDLEVAPLAMEAAVEQGLRQALSRSILFKHLDDQELGSVIASMFECRFHPGEVVSHDQRHPMQR